MVIELPSESKITSVSFSLDGSRIVGADGIWLREWKVEGDVGIRPSRMKTSSIVCAVVVSPDGRWVASGDNLGSVTIWNADTHMKCFQVTEHTGQVYAVDISGDSTRFASASRDKTVRVFNTTSGARVIPALQHAGETVGVKFSPNGSRIATATRLSGIRVYDAHSAVTLLEINMPITVAYNVSVTPLAWSSDSRQVFTASSSTITYIDTLTSSRNKWSFQKEDNYNASIINRDRFVACSAGSSVSFWDPASHKRIGRTINQTTTINCIAMSPDGRYLACGHATGITVHLLEDFIPKRYTWGPATNHLPLMEVSDAVLESWTSGSPTATEALLSDEIARCSHPVHHALATRALIRTHLGEWRTAIEDADRSLQIKLSPIGQIARCIALVGAGEQGVALDNFDFAFRDGNSEDNTFLFFAKSILMFVCGNHEQAVSRLQGLIAAADEETKAIYLQVLGNVYLKQGDYETAVQTLGSARKYPTPPECGPLMAVSLMFNWNFHNLKETAWRHLCERLHTPRSTREIGDTLLKMIDSLGEDEKELAHGHILEEIIAHSGKVTLLAWTGTSSTRNSCLPSSPAAYQKTPFVPPTLEGEELEKRTVELKAVFPLEDALVIYGRITRFQPVRFAHFHLHLPCIAFRAKSLSNNGNVYHAETDGLGDVEFTTADLLQLDEPQRFVFVNPWIHEPRFCEAVVWDHQMSSPDVKKNRTNTSELGKEADTDPVYVSVIEEVPITLVPPPLDKYTLALELIAQLGQPFSALLLWQQQDGAYKRVAADQEIVVRGTGNKLPKHIYVEVLEIV